MELLLSPTFSSHVEDLMNEHHVPGLAIAIVKNDQIASAGYGNASLEPPRPCTADTLFDIASSAKSLTAASVGVLVNDNDNYPDVQYDAIMSSLLPDDFVMPGVGYTEAVTVEDILSHRTGMAAHNSSYLSPRASQPDDARSITRNLRNLPVAAPLRTRYLYCNMMFTVATHLIEVKSQQSFSDFLQKHFFQPLSMNSTSLQPESARASGLGHRIATGYHWDKVSSTYHGFQSPDCPEGQGAGSIITSANDFIRWVKALMNCESPISEKVYHGLIRMRSLPNPNMKRLKPFTSPVVYAAGVEIYYYRGHMVVGHDGVISGFASRFFFLPAFKFGAVILGNSIGARSIATIVGQELIDEVLNVPEAERRYRRKYKKEHAVVRYDSVVNAKDKCRDQSKDVGEDEGHSKQKDNAEERENNAGKNAAKNTGRNRRKGKGEDRRKAHEKETGKEEGKTGVTGSLNSQPQTTPLNAYTGKYWHPGYHTMIIQIKDDRLFIDATDRSLGFTLVFNHISDQTNYIAHLSDLYEGGDDPIAAEFIFADDRAVKMGLQLEIALKEMIWFDRMKES